MVDEYRSVLLCYKREIRPYRYIDTQRTTFYNCNKQYKYSMSTKIVCWFFVLCFGSNGDFLVARPYFSVALCVAGARK